MAGGDGAAGGAAGAVGAAGATGVASAAGGDARVGLRAATAELARLREGELAGFELALLHGGMRPREKQEAMAAFASGGADVLVATTVIEVGIDVPNATVMLIENAERFGISQLHQLRGRVGRGEHRSSCFLVGPPGAAPAGACGVLRRLSPGGDRPGAAQRGRADGHAPVGVRPVPRGVPARRHAAAGAGARARAGDRRGGSAAARAGARAAGAGARGAAGRAGAGVDTGVKRQHHSL